MRITLQLAFMLAPLLASIAHADPSAGIAVSHAWSRATPPGAANGVVYLTIDNSGADDELLRVESPVADHVEMHNSIMRDGMMEMRPLQTLAIAAKSRVRFEPGGKHLMLIGVKQQIKEGQPVPLTLVFKRAGAVRVLAIAASMGAAEEPVHR